MSNFIDRVGDKYGRLTVVKRAVSHNNHARWICVCDCGTEVNTQAAHLASGATKSCGCLRFDHKGGEADHGHCVNGGESREYSTWRGMIQRCTNPKANHYDRYGGRGITICPEWFDFKQFYADMGDRPEGLTLDRIDNDGNYEPGNCRWTTRKEQRRSN